MTNKDRGKMERRIQHNSVSEMVQSHTEEQDFADKLAKRLADRRMVKALMALRARAGMSQKELAERIGCKQSKVSKLENGTDENASFGDLIKYTRAVGYDMHIHFAPKRQKAVDQVKFHAFCIKRLLDKIVELAGDDGPMIKATSDFFGEAAFNLAKIVLVAAADLPPLGDANDHTLQVESPGLDEECGEACPGPRREKRSASGLTNSG